MVQELKPTFQELKPARAEKNQKKGVSKMKSEGRIIQGKHIQEWNEQEHFV